MWAVVVGVMKVAESMVVVGTTLGVEVRIWAGMAAGDVVVVVRAKVKVLWVVALKVMVRGVAMATWAVVVVVIYLVVVVVVTAWTLAVVMIMTAVLIAMVTCQMSRAAVAAEQQCHC